MDFPSNSQSAKPPSPDVKNEDPKKVVEKVISGEVTKRTKKPLGRRFYETFFGGDAKSVAWYVLSEVIVPAAKDLVVSAGQEAISRMVHGDNTRPVGSRFGSRPSGPAGHYSYNRVPQQGPNSQVLGRRGEESQTVSRRARTANEYDEVLLDYKVDADEVLAEMRNRLNRYDLVSLSDFYNLVGITPSYTHEKWGWTNLERARVIRDRTGKYTFDLPEPEQLVS